jgi:hypothetical protein
MFYRGHSANPIAKPCRRLITCLLTIAASLAVFIGRPVSGAPASNQPDIFMLVYAGPNGQDNVALTYPNAVPHAQAKSDLQALATSTGWMPTHVNITDAPAPVTGSKKLMTSVVFTAHNVIPPQGRYLPLEPIVTAFRTYPHVAITYMVGDKYDFAGLRDYKDKYVSIALDARGNAYTYHVHIYDPKFPKLNLPLYQAPPSQTKAASSAPAHRRVHPWQVMLVTLLACVAGGTVYFIMSRNAPT